MKNEYHTQADTFLASNGLKFRATLSDSKAPAWSKGEQHGHHYRVTLSRDSAAKRYAKGGRDLSRLPTRLTFDFWGSIADAQKGTHPHAYDVLACLSSDVHTPDTFEDWCADLGYEADSITALQTYSRCSAFAKRLQASFTPAELEQLSEIQ